MVVGATRLVTRVSNLLVIRLLTMVLNRRKAVKVLSAHLCLPRVNTVVAVRATRSVTRVLNLLAIRVLTRVLNRRKAVRVLSTHLCLLQVNTVMVVRGTRLVTRVLNLLAIRVLTRVLNHIKAIKVFLLAMTMVTRELKFQLLIRGLNLSLTTREAQDLYLLQVTRIPKRNLNLLKIIKLIM
jgi:hypothetical protein